ncbi:hypothetical protein A0J61_03275 [Choanephora cucurbitarum]|uniref:F-box domain-containing protein n=1 Tax=Choanephora cucurbitarum TaxID=101091 RepID=A0A1C7NIN2_9FUNG|nr:hypothetical protein A0J61_03275 [Choanephora cucurbitarum]
MSFNQLPLEIYLTIFSFLPKSTLTKCQTICKACQPAASQALCERVVFSKALLKKIRSKNQTQCLSARSLEIKLFNSGTDTINESDISSLFWFLPRLKHITFNYCSSYEKVILFLSEMVKMDKANLSHVEEIQVQNITSNSAMNDLYMTINYQLCNTIKRLKLNGLRDCYIKENAIPMPDYLKQFKGLRKLVICPGILIQQTSSRSDFNIFDIFLICPNLEEFEFETHQKLGEIELKESPKYSTPAQSLKTFSFKALNLPSTYASFLIHFILPQASTFKFRLTEASIDESVLDQYMNEFSSHLHHIKNLKISGTPLTRDTLRNTTVLTNIWRCINTIKRHDPSLMTTLKIYGGKYHLTGLHLLELDSSRHHLSITVHVYADDSDIYNSCLVHSLKAGIGPDILNEIYLNDSVAVFIPLGLIEHILSSCERLKSFSVYAGDIDRGRIEFSPSGTDSQTSLSANTLSTKDLKIIKLTRTFIREDLMKTLAEKIPHTQDLCFENCFIDLDKDMNASIDLSGFIHVKTLEFNVITVDPYRRKTTYFKLEMENNTCMVYKCIARNRRETSPFELVTEKYLKSYRRIQSHNTTVITIQCPRIDKVVFFTGCSLSPRLEFHPWLDHQKCLEQ